MKKDEIGSITEELEQYFKSTWLHDSQHTESITLCLAKGWIEGVFKTNYKDTVELKNVLSNGVLLCRLINKIVPETIPFVNVGKNPITWLENVQFFLDGCRRLGLKEDMLFDPYDLKYFGNDEAELERRNRNIAITLFWLSRVAPNDMPKFGDFEHLQESDIIKESVLKDNSNTKAKKTVKAVVFEEDLCELCKKSRKRSGSGEGGGGKEQNGKFTLLVEKNEESNEFGITIRGTETDYPIITAVQNGSYAFKSGLKVGDYVITVNGINTHNMTLAMINDKIKSVFTDGHVYLGICRLPPNEVLTDTHTESVMFKERLRHCSKDDEPTESTKNVTRSISNNLTHSLTNSVTQTADTIPKIEVAKAPKVDSQPILESGLNQWRELVEKHKRDNYRSELDRATIRDLWNKYIKTSEIDEVLKEVDNFNIDKANKFKESVVQTDGNDTLNRNLTLVGHKLRRCADTYNNHVVCGYCVQAIGTLSSIHLDNTNFTYHQRCFSCKHCGVSLLEKMKLLYNVFVVDGLPYCEVCIKRMGMIRLGKVKKMPMKTSV